MSSRTPICAAPPQTKSLMPAGFSSSYQHWPSPSPSSFQGYQQSRPRLPGAGLVIQTQTDSSRHLTTWVGHTIRWPIGTGRTWRQRTGIPGPHVLASPSASLEAASNSRRLHLTATAVAASQPASSFSRTLEPRWDLPHNLSYLNEPFMAQLARARLVSAASPPRQSCIASITGIYHNQVMLTRKNTSRKTLSKRSAFVTSATASDPGCDS